MGNQEIYKVIKSIADELCRDNKTFLRADLAFELKKYGVKSDSSEVESLVFGAYSFYKNDSNISIAFVTNINPAKRNVLDLKNETCKNREKRNVLKISHTRHFKTTKKQSKTGCFYSF